MQSKYTAENVLRFWGKVQKTENQDECWLWMGYVTIYGYGQTWHRLKKLRSHRMAYEITFGEIPEGTLVCHKCDVRLCCNPSHLFLGTTKDNVKDRVEKNRSAKGERNGALVLTQKEVEEIRLRYSTGLEHQKDLARQYHVSKTTISLILLNKAWRF